MNGLAIQLASPYISVDEYARISGIPAGTVNKMIGDGRLTIRPKVKPKEKPLINMLALFNEASQQVSAA